MTNIENTFDYDPNDDFAPLYTTAQGTTLAPGEFLGEHRNYRLEKKLGEGGMAQVWLATEIEGGKELRKVVCKLLPRPVQGDSRALEQIEKVFALTQGLNHPNICPIYGMKSDKTYGWFFVMGYADGQSLEEWFQEQPNHEKGLPLPKVLEILKPLASALDYAHTQDVIHRDVKPQNVMFTGPRQTLWLLDFGIASRIHSTMTATMGSRATSGTPHFMAPEQCKSEPQDGRTDQYALATLAYFLLSGHTPFGGDFFALWGQIVSLPPQPISTLSSVANSALLKALSKDRHARFTTCDDFVRALSKNAGFVIPPIPPAPSIPAVRPKSIEELRREIYETYKAEEAKKAKKAKKAKEAEAAKRAKEAEAAEAAKRAKEELPKVTKGMAGNQSGSREASVRVSESDNMLPSYESSSGQYRGIFTLVGIIFLVLLLSGRSEKEVVPVVEESVSTEEESVSTEDEFTQALEESALAAEAAEPEAGELRTETVNGVEFTFCWCPAGTFMMGDSSTHQVTFTQGFWLLETEVTQLQWQAIMGNNPSDFKGDNLPVENISWYDCQEFCKKFNFLSGLKIGLPTEAQWEYAAGRVVRKIMLVTLMRWVGMGKILV